MNDDEQQQDTDEIKLDFNCQKRREKSKLSFKQTFPASLSPETKIQQLTDNLGLEGTVSPKFNSEENENQSHFEG